ncbi:hypothetical protein P3X46_005327 [Hevea brasiliensis]|uniref:Pectinesterase n=1 Tax=Hevea brasiliensis TaxID=3981 RepID=A0ABQ9N1C3_HEVBR|nr:pectinesterase-like [Hevea brasiliensis]KAJ9185730.1 hypothetical protein P3X46_005327 [Hevea brasiliensis]
MDVDYGDGKVTNLIVMAFSFVVIAVVIVGFASSIKTPPGDSAISTRELPPSPPKSMQKSLVPSHTLNLTSLDSICLQTDYVSTCRSSMASAFNQKNGTVQDFAKTTMQVTIRQMVGVKELANRLVKNGRIRKDYQALNDCIELVSLGLYDLQAALSLVSNSSNLSSKQSWDVKNWLSAVLAYQEACLEGLKNFKSREAIYNAIQNPKQTTSNALAIVDSNFNTQSPSKNISRRLLSQDQEHYPSWFSAAKHKLLGDYDNGELRPDALVAADGTGEFRNIAEALKAYKLNSKGWYVIYVKAGVYKENIFISKDQINVYIYGDGIDKTIVYGSKHSTDEFPAYRTAVVAVLGNGFVCKLMTIQNRATTGREAVALRIQGDKAAIFNCKIEGAERTLYAVAHRQFYRECIIVGFQDIIFGDSSIIIQKSLIMVRQPHTPENFTAITAQGRTERRETTGFVLQDCTIIKEEKIKNNFKVPTFLGRPLGKYSRIIILQSYIGNIISPEGWTMGFSRTNEKNVQYAEYENNGPGANTAKRVKWEGFKVLKSKLEALQYTPYDFIQGDL